MAQRSESTSNQPSSATNLCKMGCGFYGSSSFEGCCSKCYQSVVDNRVEKQCPNASASNAGAVAARSGSPIVASDGQTPCNKNGIPVPSRSQTSLTVSRRSSNKDMTEEAGSMDIDDDLAGKTNGGTSLAAASALTVNGNQSSQMQRGVTDATSGSSGNESDKSAFNTTDPVLSPVSAAATPANTSLAADSTQPIDIPTVAKPTAAANLSMASNASAGSFDSDSGEKSSKKRRCATCRKKVGLTGFDCRCGGLFCTEHRYADSHACEFDYKTLEREGIRKANPVVAAEKVRKF